MMRKFRPGFPTILALSIFVRVGLILYSEWHDSRSTVKYTDVDYRVFTDAGHFLLHPGPGSDNYAQGPLSKTLGSSFAIGNPYSRDTYRYTPLLAILMIPNACFPSFGKYLFALCDLLNGILLRRILVTAVLPRFYNVKDKVSQHALSSRANLYVALYLLNPMVFSISTRGSSESLLSLTILATLYAALRERWDLAAILLAFSTHWKIYPFIYGFSCLSAIQGTSHKDWRAILSNLKIFRFVLLSAGFFFLLGLGCYSIWGQPFLEHTYLYHLHRLDHRHNFSPQFYLTYLTYKGGENGTFLPTLHRVLTSSLVNFLPQLILSIGSGILCFKHIEDLDFAWFIQTCVFVLFNKVCTSQYFLWYLHFLPLLAPRFATSLRTSILLGVVWVGSQALWLASAYELEFLGRPVFLSLWYRSLIYFVSHCVVLVILMGSYNNTSGRLVDTNTKIKSH